LPRRVETKARGWGRVVSTPGGDLCAGFERKGGGAPTKKKNVIFGQDHGKRGTEKGCRGKKVLQTREKKIPRRSGDSDREGGGESVT